MASYFNATNTAHLALLTRSVRAHQDLATEAAKAERDVIMFYTLRQAPYEMYTSQFTLSRGYPKGNGVYVCLEGFDPDADVVDDEELVVALRDTIADVLAWRLTKYAESPLLGSVSTAVGSSKTFLENATADFPPRDWCWRLQRWDLRPPLYTAG